MPIVSVVGPIERVGNSFGSNLVMTLFSSMMAQWYLNREWQVAPCPRSEPESSGQPDALLAYKKRSSAWGLFLLFLAFFCWYPWFSEQSSRQIDACTVPVAEFVVVLEHQRLCAKENILPSHWERGWRRPMHDDPCMFCDVWLRIRSAPLRSFPSYPIVQS